MKRTSLFALSGSSLMLYILQLDLSVFINRLRRISYVKFNTTLAEATHLVCLLLLLTLIYPKPTGPMKKQLAGQWGIAFSLVMLSLTGLASLRTRTVFFPWKMQTPILIAARSQKVQLYQRLNYSPQVIIMGSSRAFLISSAQLEQATGYTAFNMAVEGGGLVDFLALERFVLSQPQPAPLLMIVELASPGLLIQHGQNMMPINMMPYLTAGHRLISINQAFEDMTGFQPVSDALYGLILQQKPPASPTMSFQADGTGIRKPIREDDYLIRIKEQSINLDKAQQCDGLDPKGMKELDEYVNVLMEEYDNIMFRDLTFYYPITSLKWDGYNDTQHFKPKAADMLANVLAPDVNQMIKWALQKRD